MTSSRLQTLIRCGAAIACAAIAGAYPHQSAEASVSVAVTFDALVAASDAVALATPIDEHAQVEGGKIFTYTRLHVDGGVAGEAASDSEVTVRAFGGVVDHIGMVSEGEPTFSMGQQQLVFLRHGAVAGTYVVTADAQGQFVVMKDAKRFKKSRAVGLLLQPKDGARTANRVGETSSQSVNVKRTSALAADVIENRSTSDVVRDVANAYRRLHAR
jgi:hypothetical protein